MSSRSLKMIIVVAVIAAAFCSCTTYKNIPYFPDFADSTQIVTLEAVPFKNPVIKPDDLLTISIQTVNPEVNAILNGANVPTQLQGSSTAVMSAQPQATPGYIVDKDGNVELPFTGAIKVQGLTTAEAREAIKKAMLNYIKDPIVNVKYANFRVTVLGEVVKPATYIMPTERVTIFDALGQAGDMTIFGKRENVVLIRDNGEQKKTMVHLNLNSKDIITSPWYYLQPNDVVYVEPNKQKAVGADAAKTRNVTIALSALSLIVAIVNFSTR